MASWVRGAVISWWRVNHWVWGLLCIRLVAVALLPPGSGVFVLQARVVGLRGLLSLHSFCLVGAPTW